MSEKRILLTGATGFIGQAVYPELLRQGYEIVCTTRYPERARENHPSKTWVKMDVSEPDTVRKAMDGIDTVFYLIHSMSSGEGYKEREKKAARNLRDGAEKSGVERVIYLGGVAPDGEVSDHLESRLRTGEILRSGTYSVIELRAAMILGQGSASWQIVRDLAARLPIMILPSWTQSRSQPVFVDDVVEALVGAIELEGVDSEWFDIPGPDVLTVEEILRRTARKLGNNPYQLRVPLLTPKLSSYWLRFVTRSNLYLARELVEGLKTDLLAEDDRYWDLIGYENRTPFEDAVEITLRRSEQVPLLAGLYERSVNYLSPSD
ncbi:MAG: NAD(P)H-binding protein [bacterium]